MALWAGFWFFASLFFGGALVTLLGAVLQARGQERRGGWFLGGGLALLFATAVAVPVVILYALEGGTVLYLR